MKAKLLTIIACFMLSQSTAQERYISPPLEKYVLEFKEEARKRFVNIDSLEEKVHGIVLEDRMKFPMLGVYVPEYKVIFITPYTLVDKLIVRAVVFHELGHAFIGSGHTCKVCPSIMSAKTPTTHAIYANEETWQLLLDEFFELFPK